MIKKEFRLYTPTEPEKIKIAETHNVLFHISKDGEDWYDVQSLFSYDNYNVVYEPESGHIFCVVNDVSSFCPRADTVFSVSEVESVPDNFILNGSFVFNEKTGKIEQKISDFDMAANEVTLQVKKLRQHATNKMEPLLYAEELDSITSDEKQLLKKWKKFVLDISRIPKQSGYPFNVIWPEKPE